MARHRQMSQRNHTLTEREVQIPEVDWRILKTLPFCCDLIRTTLILEAKPFCCYLIRTTLILEAKRFCCYLIRTTLILESKES